jgi:N-acetylglucosaminyldiphosphoundecaprenol N-acetyl-beta-D-mannosaminyltransferase
MRADLSGLSASTKCPVLGVEMFAGSLEAAALAVLEKAETGAGGYVCQCNVHVLTLSERVPQLRRVLDHAAAVFPDGAPLAWLQRQSGLREAERVGGPDLMAAVVAKGGQRGLRHYLLGSTPNVLAALERSLVASNPGVSIVGALAPPFGSWDSAQNDEIIGSIRSAGAHVVWCGLGAPRQELWMGEHAEQVAPALLIGVGAAFDFIAGKKRRAPNWMQKCGLEWIHRLANEPRRLWRRYLTQSFFFTLALIRHYGAKRSRSVDPSMKASA